MWHPALGMLHLGGHLGQDTEPPEQNCTAAAAIATIRTVAVPEYNDAGAGSVVREDAVRHGGKSGC